MQPYVETTYLYELKKAQERILYRTVIDRFGYSKFPDASDGLINRIKNVLALLGLDQNKYRYIILKGDNYNHRYAIKTFNAEDNVAFIEALERVIQENDHHRIPRDSSTQWRHTLFSCQHEVFRVLGCDGKDKQTVFTAEHWQLKLTMQDITVLYTLAENNIFNCERVSANLYAKFTGESHSVEKIILALKILEIKPKGIAPWIKKTSNDLDSLSACKLCFDSEQGLKALCSLFNDYTALHAQENSSHQHSIGFFENVEAEEIQDAWVAVEDDPIEFEKISIPNTDGFCFVNQLNRGDTPKVGEGSMKDDNWQSINPDDAEDQWRQVHSSVSLRS